jgi:hypothetical protein
MVWIIPPRVMFSGEDLEQLRIHFGHLRDCFEDLFFGEILE